MTPPDLTPPLTPVDARPPHYSLVLWGTLVATLVLGAVLWEQDVKNRIFPRNFGIVEKGVLFRSGRLSFSTAEHTFKDYKIAHVVSLIGDTDNPDTAKPMVDAITELGLTRTVLPMNGNGLPSSPSKYADAIESIVLAEREGKPTLVHCNAGAQRTGGVIATYKLLVKREPVDAVVAEMKRFGHDPKDNPKLIPWLNENLPAIRDDLEARGINVLKGPLPTLMP